MIKIFLFSLSICAFLGAQSSHANKQYCATIQKTVQSTLQQPTALNVTKSATKDLAKLPKHIQASYKNWEDSVKTLGIHEVRKIPGYHDEPLYSGERSVRLNQAYRIFYREIRNETGQLVLHVTKVCNHCY